MKNQVSMTALLLTSFLWQGSAWAEAENEVASGEGSVALEEIIVSATRRAESLIDVPVSVSVVSGDRIDKSNFERVTDMQYSTPGFVQTGQETSGWIQMTMRGISTTTVTTGYSLGIGMFVDGVDQGAPFAFSQELIDIAQIEVLKGPQGTLYGKNTISGAFVVTTVKPDVDDAHVYADAEIGNYGTYNVKGSVSVPIVEGKFAAKLSLYSKISDGFVENVVTGGTLNDQNQQGGRLQLRFTPSDALTIDVSFDYLNERRKFAYHEIIENLAGGIDYNENELPPGLFSVSHDFDDTEERDLWGAGVVINYDFGDGYNLTSVTGYRYGRDDIVEDTDHTSFDDQTYYQNKNFDQFSQEIKFLSPSAMESGKSYDYLLGVYATSQDNNQLLAYKVGPDNWDGEETQSTPSTLASQQVAMFAQGNYFFTDRLSLNAGVRLNYEHKKMTYSEDGYVTVFDFPATPYFEDEFSETTLTPMVGLNFKPTEDSLLYAKYTKGYKSGAFDLGIFKGGVGDFSFDSEKLNSFEVGFKGSLLDGRATVGLSGFYMDYTSLQLEISIPATEEYPVGVRSRGDAAAIIKGIEVETVLRPLDGLTLEAGTAYINSQYKDEVSVYGGNGLPNSPKWTSYANATFEFDINDSSSVYIRGEWTNRTAWFKGPENHSHQKSPGFSLLNASAGIELESGWAVSIWGKNLANKEYCTELWEIIGGMRCGISRPRTYGLALTFKN